MCLRCSYVESAVCNRFTGRADLRAEFLLKLSHYVMLVRAISTSGKLMNPTDQDQSLAEHSGDH